MNIQRWIARREPDWKQLDSLLTRTEKQGIKSLRAPEIKQLASLYRSVSADLARAQTHKVGQTLVQDLQLLTSRSYSQIYQGSRKQEWQAVREFYLWGFPALVQQTAMYTAIATALFMVAVLVAWWFSWQDPTFQDIFLPSHLISKVRDEQELWMWSILGIEPVAASNIMINNMAVSFKTLAGGIFAGLGTIYILILNGLLIGAIGALVGQNQLAYPFWAFVFPHGSLELPAIFLAGGAGLLLARALVFPGHYRRIDALKVYGTQAAQLMYGVVPLLFIAGVIEGFFSPSPLVPDLFKYIVGTGLFWCLLMYCSRRRTQTSA